MTPNTIRAQKINLVQPKKSWWVAMPGAGWPYAITLMIMHMLAGVITVGMLIKLTATQSQADSTASLQLAGWFGPFDDLIVFESQEADR